MHAVLPYVPPRYKNYLLDSSLFCCIYNYQKKIKNIFQKLLSFLCNEKKILRQILLAIIYTQYWWKKIHFVLVFFNCLEWSVRIFFPQDTRHAWEIEFLFFSFILSVFVYFCLFLFIFFSSSISFDLSLLGLYILYISLVINHNAIVCDLI